MDSPVVVGHDEDDEVAMYLKNKVNREMDMLKKFIALYLILVQNRTFSIFIDVYGIEVYRLTVEDRKDCTACKIFKSKMYNGHTCEEQLSSIFSLKSKDIIRLVMYRDDILYQKVK